MADNPQELAAQKQQCHISDRIASARRSYADELNFMTGMRSPALLEAFASVPRERFVGDGPWQFKTTWSMDEYWTTPSAEPTSVYHDVLIALDAERNINNGQPSLWAFSFSHLASAKDEHVLHLGCGTGYYTAILATLIGAGGRITAIELDPVLCARAREALAPWPNVTVQQSDGSDALSEPADIIVASAGATHPRLTWLSALKRGGRLLFPMTGTRGWGGMLLVNKFGSGHFSARFLCRVAFIGFSGMRDPEFARRIDNLFMQERGAGVKSLRLDDHPQDETCWFHNANWCLSSNNAAQELAS